MKIVVHAEHTNLCGRICRNPEDKNPDDVQVFEGDAADLLEIAECYSRMPSSYGTRVAAAIRRECEESEVIS